MEVEKYKEIGEVVSYEFGNLINKKLTKSFKKNLRIIPLGAFKSMFLGKRIF